MSKKKYDEAPPPRVPKHYNVKVTDIQLEALADYLTDMKRKATSICYTSEERQDSAEKLSVSVGLLQRLGLRACFTLRGKCEITIM